MKFEFRDSTFPYSLRKRFVKNTSAPITLFKDPFFWEQLDFYNLRSDYNLFAQELSAFNSEDAYFTYCTSLMEELISVIKNDAAYSQFSSNKPLHVGTLKLENERVLEDVPLSFVIRECGFHDYPRKFYTDQNVGKTCVAWDISGANMISLLFFGFFQEQKYLSWKEFISHHTTYLHLHESKSFRQAVFGHANPKRQQLIQQYIMTQFLQKLPAKGILSLTSDEMVLEWNNENITFDVRNFPARVHSPFLGEDVGIPMKQRQFELRKILVDNSRDFSHPVTSCYLEKHEKPENSRIKGCSRIFRPLVERMLRQERLSDSLWEYAFEYEHILSRFEEDLYVSIM